MKKSIFTDDYNYFCELLIESRNEHNLTQSELAQKLAKPQSFVSKYEIGERRLDVVEFIEIAHAIGIDPVKIISKLVKYTKKRK